ncbi:serine carboxypeptidase-like 35 [Typha latifolia]|uniref:serine carboxypeptidase-like 35 n=1 Tax=Typha latifolia TaxID=4733 RepID=UPI003C2E5010
MATFLWVVVFLAMAVTLEGMRSAGGEADLVRGLPGEPPAVGFRHYAGYVGVGRKEGKSLFYWFFEAEQEPEEKPLVLWLNGGPGCSSVAYGAAQELGPFLVRSNGPNLTLNAYSWNKVANLLFLEAPVGVGFSYTNRSLDLKELGDRITAEDSYSFLQNWFRKFPRFKSHDFFIAGESYAGHYVPQLAESIFEGNKEATKGTYINLKGFMIGNAVLNDETDQLGMVEYAWSHAIISDELYSAVRKECDSFKEEEEGGKPSKACSPAVKAFLQAYDDIDIYSIYTPICLSSLSSSRRSSKLRAAPHLFSQHEQWHGIRSMPAGYDPCTEDYVKKYFNREDVQRALHANLTHLTYAYSPCSEIIHKWNDSPSSVLPVLKKLMNAGIHIWVYSGDTDGRVPVTSTRYSINAMKLHAKEKRKRKGWGGWRPWYYKEQVAGWVVEYEKGLTFATVRGAGHQVPVFAPDRSLSLFSHFLGGRSLPSSRFSQLN